MVRFIRKFILPNPARKRLASLKTKQSARLERLKIVVKVLQEWDDIPISWQFTSICSTLEIKPDKAAQNFIYSLLLSDLNLE